MATVKEQLEKKKSNLEALKAKGGQGWTSKLQEELDNVAVSLVDVNEIYEEKAAEAGAEKPEQQETEEKPKAAAKYEVAKGTEKLVHIKIVSGRRYNPNTGKEMTKPTVQLFTFAEWQLFKKNFKGLGFIITEVLHDPYNDAEQYVTKDEKNEE